MVTYQIRKSTLHGSLTIPPSKSQTMRALLFAMMAKGQSTIYNYLPSPDTNAMLAACRHLGAEVTIFPDRIEIFGNDAALKAPEREIHAGNSGIILRFIAAIASLSTDPVLITGDHSICHQRPVKPLLEGLTQLGASAISVRGNGYAPIRIQGKIKAGTAILSGEDSQPVSALLIAALFGDGPVQLEVLNPGEKPWVGMTLSWFDRLGASYQNRDFTYYRIEGNHRYAGFSYSVPGDLSSAAFPIVAALVTKSELALNNVDLSDAQGDKALITVLQEMGAVIDYNPTQQQLTVRRAQAPLQGLSLDINSYIDAIAVLAVMGCFAEGVTELRNAAVARTKECDRIHCLALELRKMGAKIEELDDGLRISSFVLHGADLDSHNDQRLAMALTVAALGAEGKSTINGAEWTTKTFPGFFDQLKALGANIVA